MAERRTGYTGFSNHGEIVAALSRFPAERVGELFADILAIAGIQTVGGRSTAEIAERVVEQAMLAAEDPHSRRALRTRSAPSGGRDPLSGAVEALAKLSGTVGRPARFEAAVADFARRVEAIGADGAGATFSATFGRKLGYYDGFVFDLYDTDRPGAGQVAGGGRYDGLTAGFGASSGVRAVGFAYGPNASGGGMTQKLIVAIPSKGRLQEQTLAFFERSGLAVVRRAARATISGAWTACPRDRGSSGRRPRSRARWGPETCISPSRRRSPA